MTIQTYNISQICWEHTFRVLRMFRPIESLQVQQVDTHRGLILREIWKVTLWINTRNVNLKGGGGRGKMPSGAEKDLKCLIFTHANL